MKNILMITPLYPLFAKENRITYVCHFFAREWVKMGYNIVVIHLQPVHCWLWHVVVKINGRNGSPTSYARKLKETERYIVDQVPIYRIPVYQFTPRFPFSRKVLLKFSNDLVSILQQRNFTPDMIVGHCMSPHIIPVVNERFHVKTVMVAHGPGLDLKKRFKNWGEIIDSYSAWGFRALPIQRKFEKGLKKVKQSFICYSGIPEDYIVEKNKHDFSLPLQKFVYVGDLIKRKHPMEVIDALKKVYPEKNFNMTYVGDGEMMSALKAKVVGDNLTTQVSLLGKIKRDSIKEQYDKSDCMVMISYGEAYGLVYLEAMARGCITISSRDEGMDGVIIDGVNGFLCKAGDSAELAEIIKRINNLSAKERQIISERAIETAKSFTDYKAAYRYIEDLKKV